MSKLSKRVGILSAAFLFVFFSSCSKDDDSSTPPAEPPIETESVSGTLQVFAGSTLGATELEAASFVAEADLTASGAFTLDIPMADKYGMVLFNEKVSGDPVYVGLHNPISGAIVANDTSTAQALTMMTLNLMMTEQTEREEYLNAVKQNGMFPQLLAALQQAYQTDAATALDYDVNPTIYQLAVQIMVETMQNLGIQAAKPGTPDLGDPPFIEDAPGANVTFVNPRHIYYGAGIYPNDQQLDEVVTVNRRGDIIEFHWGWPPEFVWGSPEETDYALGDGYFRVYLTKGGDFSTLVQWQWDDPVGRATIYNTGQVILSIVELSIGQWFPAPMINLPNYITISEGQAAQLAIDIAQGDEIGFFVHFMGIVGTNSGAIALWIWEGVQNEAASNFLTATAKMMENAAFVLKLLNFANSTGPFVFDLVFAPSEVSYYVTQEAGTIISMTQNDPPVPAFSAYPPAGVVGTNFSFDASATTDDLDDLSELQFRWDWNGDGTWDTPWSSNYMATHSYADGGAYEVALQVRDTSGLMASLAHILNVGGGAGTANHVKYFRDVLPWDTNALVEVLEGLGFTAGTGPNTYEIITSDQMASVPLVAGEDLVIISNDQNQIFYDNYSASQIRFTNFVYMGGALYWEACDEGWAGGSIANAGIVLPGNITSNFVLDNYNYITDPDLPLVQGVATEIWGNYASHENFTNLVDGTTVYCVDQGDIATLIEFNLGGGWMIVTGQPLEAHYAWGWDGGPLLSNIVAYFTGQPIAAAPQAPQTRITGSLSTTHR